MVALAATPPASLVLGGIHAIQAATAGRAGLDIAYASSQGCTSAAAPSDTTVTVPPGAQQCPASGPGAACATKSEASAAKAGVASTPDGQSPCPTAGSPGLSSPAACTDVLLSPVNAAKPGDSLTPRVVAPSVPVTSLRPGRSAQRLDLVASDVLMPAGQKTILTATASSSITGTSTAIQIFDQTTNPLVGACSQSSQCIVAYAALSGEHTFGAFITAPGAGLPTDGGRPS